MIRTKELGETSTSAEQETSGGIQIGTELSEGSDFTVLSEVELERTSELLHDLAVDRYENERATSQKINR